MTQTAAPERGRELVPADQRQPLRDRRVGRDDDRVRRHHAAGGVGVVGEQHAHVVRLLRLHQVEQRLAALVGQLRDQVGGVVRLHLLEHVGGAVVAEPGEDLDAGLLRHLLEHVGEALVGELVRDLEHPLLGQVEHRGGEVGGGQVGRRLDQLRGATGCGRRCPARGCRTTSRTRSRRGRTGPGRCGGGGRRPGRPPTPRGRPARWRRPRSSTRPSRR